MKRRNTVTLVIAAVLAIALLAGCGSTATTAPAAQTDTQTTAQSSGTFHPGQGPRAARSRRHVRQ